MSQKNPDCCGQIDLEQTGSWSDDIHKDVRSYTCKNCGIKWEYFHGWWNPWEQKNAFAHFRCVCGKEHNVEYSYGHGDSFDFHCDQCGKYYKKTVRIEESQWILG